MSSNSRKNNHFFHRHYELLLELPLLPLLAIVLLDKAASSSGPACPGGPECPVLVYCCAGAALLASAAAIPFVFSRHSKGRAAGGILLWAACILLAGVYVQFRLRLGRQYWGLPPEDVAIVCGTMAADSCPDGMGGERGRIRLTAVEDRFGSSAAASGTAEVRFKGTLRRFQGRQVRIPAQLIQIGAPAPLRCEPPAYAAESGYLYKVAALGPEQAAGYTAGIMRRRAATVLGLRKRLRSVGRAAPPLLQALLLGYRPEGSGGLVVLFRRAGCAHLLALSGMHLGVLSIGLLILLTPLLGRRPALVLSLMGICAYLLLVGPRPSMLRAVLMYGLGVSAVLFFGLRMPGHYLVAVTFLLHVVLLPGDCETLGFQLSYTALYGICIWTPAVSRCLPAALPRTIREVAAATVAAQCSTAFLVVQSFAVLYPVGFLTPLLLTPLVTIWMCCGLVYLLWTMVLSCFPAMLPPGTIAPALVAGDRLFRAVLERAAEITTAVVSWCGRFRPLQIPEEKCWLVAIGALGVLTLFSLTQYAGRYVRRIKLQLSEIDRPIPAGEWNGPHPPLWTEFSHFTSGAREDSQAA